jgi:DNA-binding transcriptional MerR regulator
MPGEKAAIPVTAAADLLGCSPQTVRNWIAQGILTGSAQQLAQRKRWRVELDSVLALKDRQATRAALYFPSDAVAAQAEAARPPEMSGRRPPSAGPPGSPGEALARARAAEARSRQLEAVAAARAEANARLRAALAEQARVHQFVQAELLAALELEQQATTQLMVPDDAAALE